MNNIDIRNPQETDVPFLLNLWENVFGTAGMKAFFQKFYSHDLCIIAEYNNTPAAMGYLVPFGEIMIGSDPILCQMIYSVATLPEFRGKGLGSAVTNELVRHANGKNFPAVVLCPSDDDLFNFYSSNTKFREWFYVDESIYINPNNSIGNFTLTEVHPIDYKVIREELLKGKTYIKNDLISFEYQYQLCNELGGGLFIIGNACAIIERQTDDIIWVKELLIPESDDIRTNNSDLCNEIVSAIAFEFPGSEYIIRKPAYTSTGRRFGMLELNGLSTPVVDRITYLPWYGMAFD